MGLSKKQNKNNQKFKIAGLLFESKKDYITLKKCDINIDIFTLLINKIKTFKLENLFSKETKIFNVKETYYNAGENLDGLFPKATALLCYEGTRFIDDYKVGCAFFDKINLIKYSDSDSDCDIDSSSDFDVYSDSDSNSDDDYHAL